MYNGTWTLIEKQEWTISSSWKFAARLHTSFHYLVKSGFTASIFWNGMVERLWTFCINILYPVHYIHLWLLVRWRTEPGVSLKTPNERCSAGRSPRGQQPRGDVGLSIIHGDSPTHDFPIPAHFPARSSAQLLRRTRTCRPSTPPPIPPQLCSLHSSPLLLPIALAPRPRRVVLDIFLFSLQVQVSRWQYISIFWFGGAGVTKSSLVPHNHLLVSQASSEGPTYLHKHHWDAGSNKERCRRSCGGSFQSPFVLLAS